MPKSGWGSEMTRRLPDGTGRMTGTVRRLAWLTAGLLCMYLGCGKGELPMKTPSAPPQLSEADLANIRSLRIVFGHQSVGGNLIDGLKTLGAEIPSYRLNLVEAGTDGSASGPAFAHFRVGSNGDPGSKIAAFKSQLLGPVPPPDVAFFKFCYLDIGAQSNADRLFQEYRAAIDELHGRLPGVSFIHVTAPLTTLDHGVKRLAKKLLGKSTGEEANLARSRYNDLMRQQYLGKEPLFDLAALESIAADGSTSRGECSGAPCQTLHPANSDDGGHLNREASRRAAQGLLQVLAALPGTGN
jgi:hypothetical protein